MKLLFSLTSSSDVLMMSFRTLTARDPDGLSAIQEMAVTTAASAGPQSDREALEALYDATGGADWTDGAGWKTLAPLGEWYGVTTGAAGRVTRLGLDDNGLTGSIPTALGSLASLEELDLDGNALGGPIPGELGGLANLGRLSLSENGLAGPIPGDLGSLADLEELQLGGNALTGWTWPTPGACRGRCRPVFGGRASRAARRGGGARVGRPGSGARQAGGSHVRESCVSAEIRISACTRPIDHRQPPTA